MHKIPLYDSVSVKAISGNGISLFCDRYVCEEQDNLAYRAAEEYMKRLFSLTGKTRHITIAIKKRIPEKAGLGGGSTDGSAVLDALELLFGAVGQKELESIAASLGSDMPFCLRRYSCGLCTGRGTDIEALPMLPKCYLLAACPVKRMCTTGIYSEFDRRYGLEGTDAIDGAMAMKAPSTLLRQDHEVPKSILLAEGLRRGSLAEICKHGVNHFEGICIEKCGEIAGIQAVMRKHGALLAQMSGSGSAVFGVFAGREQMDACRSALSETSFCTLFPMEIE